MNKDLTTIMNLLLSMDERMTGLENAAAAAIPAPTTSRNKQTTTKAQKATTTKKETTVTEYHRTATFPRSIIIDALTTRRDNGERYTAPEGTADAWLPQGGLTFAQLDRMLAGTDVTYTTKKGRKILVTMSRKGSATTTTRKAVSRKASAPVKASMTKRELVLSVIEADENADRIWNAASVAEATGLTASEAKTQLNSLTGKRIPAEFAGRIVRHATKAGRYMAA